MGGREVQKSFCMDVIQLGSQKNKTAGAGLFHLQQFSRNIFITAEIGDGKPVRVVRNDTVDAFHHC